MTTETISILSRIQSATMEARKKTGRPRLGLTVKSGLFMVIDVAYMKSGKSVVTKLSGFLPLDDAINEMLAVS